MNNAEYIGPQEVHTENWITGEQKYRNKQWIQDVQMEYQNADNHKQHTP